MLAQAAKNSLNISPTITSQPKIKPIRGKSINYDDGDYQPVRDYILSNAKYWIEEYHFDGLRLDATQNIYDDTDSHILMEITRTTKPDWAVKFLSSWKIGHKTQPCFVIRRIRALE